MPLAHLLIILLINLSWGSSFLTIKYNVVHFGPYFSLALRYLVLTLPLLPFLGRVPVGSLKPLVLVGTLMGVFHFGLGMTAFHLAADLASLAIAAQLYIPLAALLAVWFLKEQVTWPTIAGVALAFSGIAVMSFDPLIFTQLDSLFAMIVSALVLAVCSLIIRSRLGQLHPLTLQAWIGLCGFLPILLLSCLVEERQWERLVSATWINWGSVLHVILFSSILGHGMNFWLLQRQPISRVTPYYLLTPLIGVLMAVIFWGDTPGARVWFGGAGILGGVALVSWADILKRRSRTKAAPVDDSVPGEASL